MRRQLPLKSKTYPEGRLVNEAGISGKVYAQYPGRSQDLSNSSGLLSSRGDGKRLEKSAEGIVFREVGRRPEPVVVCRVAVQRALSRSLERGP